MILGRSVFILLAACAVPASAAVLYDGTAALVGTRLVTVQDAYFYRAIQRFKDGETAPAPLEKGDPLRRTVQRLAFEEMVQSEMKSLQFELGNKGDAEKVIREKSRGNGAGRLKSVLRTFGRTEADAVEVLSRSSEVERFLQKKVETLTPIVTEAESEAYYAQNQARFKGSSYRQLRPNIVLLLRKERMQKGLEEWIRFLKEKYGVTSYLDG